MKYKHIECNNIDWVKFTLQPDHFIRTHTLHPNHKYTHSYHESKDRNIILQSFLSWIVTDIDKQKTILNNQPNHNTDQNICDIRFAWKILTNMLDCDPNRLLTDIFLALITGFKHRQTPQNFFGEKEARKDDSMSEYYLFTKQWIHNYWSIEKPEQRFLTKTIIQAFQSLDGLITKSLLEYWTGLPNNIFNPLTGVMRIIFMLSTRNARYTHFYREIWDLQQNITNIVTKIPTFEDQKKITQKTSTEKSIQLID